MCNEGNFAQKYNAIHIIRLLSEVCFISMFNINCLGATEGRLSDLYSLP